MVTVEKTQPDFRGKQLWADAPQLSEGLIGRQLAADKSGQTLFCQLAICQA